MFCLFNCFVMAYIVLAFWFLLRTPAKGRKRPKLSPYRYGTNGMRKKEFNRYFKIDIDEEFIHSSLKRK